MIYGGPGADEGLSGQEGDDVIYAGPGNDSFLDGSEGEDVIYGGDGNDSLSGLHSRYLHFLHPSGLHAQRDELYCGKGQDSYLADKLDYVDSSCEKKKRPGGSQA
jgi:Ca2+-binding RTX toxin-like protein